VARKNQQAFAKRQRERKKAEKAAKKRERRADRKEEKLHPPEALVPTEEDLDSPAPTPDEP
jgi:hypothetical protein